MELEVLMICSDYQPESFSNSSMATTYPATITGPLYPLGPANDIRIWFIDSGPTSHFTPHPETIYMTRNPVR
eukprot:7788230-Ditylum_brightwellii.AAC.1